MESRLDRLVREVRACRRCVDAPWGAPLPHAPRPVLRVSTTARICVAGQAPGTRVHVSGVPFSDPSGERLRAWMGVTPDEFYDEKRVAIVPMGFCFPGLDAKGGDRPPRRECADQWRARVFQELESLDLILLVGQYAQAWHLGQERGPTLTDTVKNFETVLAAPRNPRLFPLPHPSWRNSGWIAKNPWFEAKLLPRLRREVRQLL